ncbi:MAG: SHOCT domain-containing protein, partial [Bacillota bacterium]|nr:SHOCT domain-containing protein [Bacillota bacterium]
MGRMRVKPSKPSSLVGMLTGVIFVFIGLFVAIPSAGGFGVIWTLFAVIITASNAYNFFSEDGISSYEINIDSDNERYGSNSRNNFNSASAGSNDFEDKLRKLERLKEDGLLTEDEYQM